MDREEDEVGDADADADLMDVMEEEMVDVDGGPDADADIDVAANNDCWEEGDETMKLTGAGVEEITKTLVDGVEGSVIDVEVVIAPGTVSPRGAVDVLPMVGVVLGGGGGAIVVSFVVVEPITLKCHLVLVDYL